jgi:hypothetical protein
MLRRKVLFMRFRRSGLGAAMAAWAVLVALPVSAGAQGFTSRSAFLAALPGTASTLSFDALSAGTTIASGTGTGGITFTYNFGGPLLRVTTAYPAPSPTRSLGTTDADILQDGDNLRLAFSGRNAIGLSIVSRELLRAGDLTLTAGGTTATLAPSIQRTLSDGANVYFLGVIGPTTAFTSATLTTVGGGFFFYNLDDVISATSPDTDGDGIANSADNCTLVANNGQPQTGPSQHDADGDGYGNLCDADLNNTGLVTSGDFGLLRSVLNLSAASSPLAAAADLNGSGTVTTADFAILRAGLNLPPGPSGLVP